MTFIRELALNSLNIKKKLNIHKLSSQWTIWVAPPNCDWNPARAEKFWGVVSKPQSFLSQPSLHDKDSANSPPTPES